MRKHQHRKKINLLKSFIQYGFHLWILLFVSNLLIFYSFNLFTFGAEQQSPPTDISPALSAAVSAIEATPTRPPAAKPTKVVKQQPKGPVISLSLALPGIGSGGGTMNPSRKSRNLTVFLYAKDVNSYDSKVKPLHTIRTRAAFDENPDSPTYTSFINREIFMGEDVKEGKYQVAYLTDQSIIGLVKEKPDAIGGQLINVTLYEVANIPVQPVIMGDIIPNTGDNVMDIADWNAFVDCYTKQEECTSFKYADLNDDGKIDGIDYNILIRGYLAYHELGFPVTTLPSPMPTQVSKLSELKITPKVSAKPKEKPSLSPSPAVAVAAKQGSNPLGAILGFFFFMLLILGGVFGASKTKFGKAFLATHPIPILTPKAPKPGDGGAAQAADGQAAPAEGQESPPTDGATVPAEGQPIEGEQPAAEVPADATAESTEIPIESLQAEKAAGDAAPAEQAPGAAPATAATAPADGSIDKTYYVKNKSKDDKGTWVVLTDDAGPVDGLYQGDIEDGFERIKGTMVEENGKKYIKITEVLPSEG